MKNIVKSLAFLFLFMSSSLMAQNWESLNSGTSYILFDISIPPGQSEVIYAAGMQYTYNAEGVIIKSTDGGDSWQQIVGGSGTIGFEAICFTSENTGYVAGWDGYIAKTTDGGGTWTTMNTGGDNWYFGDLEFWDADHGIAMANLNSGASGVYVTANGGDTWSVAFGLNQNVQDIAYADANTLYAVGGDEKISISTNGGGSWSQIYSGIPSYFFIGVGFNGDFGAIGGEDGKIMSTTDGGSTWSTFATGYENFQGIYVFDNDSAYVGGTDENIYKTTNWGQNWDWEENGTGFSHIYKIKFAEDGTGFLCGSQGMIKRKAAPLVPLMADFTADETDICDATEVNFSDMSTGAVETWSWTFEGGYPSDSQEPNPTISYLAAGTYDVSLTVTDGTNENTIIMEDYITVHNCTGISEDHELNINLYPNPAINTLSIQGSYNEGKVRILDLSGRIVLESEMKKDLDISEIPTGVYMIEIESRNQMIKKKLIIQK